MTRLSRRDSTTEQADQRIYDRDVARDLPEKVLSLRQKLNRKAKQEPKFRFYALYDRIYRRDVLEAAWDSVRANGGSAGVDGESITDVERSIASGQDVIGEIQGALQRKKYKPQAVRRVHIPKANGGKRPLGIPTVRDRVVQTAAMLILEPIFEADFEECSCGFRPGRSAHDALRKIHGALKAGLTEVYDADLKGYFDSIPHDKLMECLKMRISDRSVLKLIRMWLEAPVEEHDENGKKTVKRPTQGTPQGGVISPLLANLYLHWFDKIFHFSSGPSKWANARLVRYADDFVVLARFQGPRLIAWIEEKLEGWMKLEINREKTRVVKLLEPKEQLDFLGYTFRYDRDLKGRPLRYWNLFPSKKSVKREREVVKARLKKYWALPVHEAIKLLNRNLVGWGNYFRLGYPKMTFRDLDRYVRECLAKHLQRRSQRPYRIPSDTTMYEFLKKQGLVRLAEWTDQLPAYSLGEGSGNAGCGKSARPV